MKLRNIKQNFPAVTQHDELPNFPNKTHSSRSTTDPAVGLAAWVGLPFFSNPTNRDSYTEKDEFEFIKSNRVVFLMLCK